ncbi:hypothetical protein [Lysinibacillus telephonicus]
MTVYLSIIRGLLLDKGRSSTRCRRLFDSKEVNITAKGCLYATLWI